MASSPSGFPLDDDGRSRREIDKDVAIGLGALLTENRSQPKTESRRMTSPVSHIVSLLHTSSFTLPSGRPLDPLLRPSPTYGSEMLILPYSIQSN